MLYLSAHAITTNCSNVARSLTVRIRAKFCDVPCLPVSARCELQLQQLSRQGVISYHHGSDHCDVLDNFNASIDGPQLQYIRDSVWSRCVRSCVTEGIS